MKQKLLEYWDTAAAMSRAGFERRLPVILRRLARPDGTAATAPVVASRAGFAMEVPESTGR
jgi:hypothetical protein